MTRAAAKAFQDVRPEPLTTPAEARGTTDISERVVQRIAAKVVNDAERAGRGGPAHAPRLAGQRLRRDRTQISARVDGQIATVDVTMSVAYSQPVREVSRRVRNDVIDTVGELTGLNVRHVDISITSLLTGGNRRRVQ